MLNLRYLFLVLFNSKTLAKTQLTLTNNVTQCENYKMFCNFHSFLDKISSH